MAISTFVVLFALFAIAQSQTSTYSFSQFDSTTVSKFQLNGYAANYNPESGNRLLLSISSPGTAGSAFLKNSIPLTGENGFQASFSTAFSFIITNSGGISDEDGVGADGIVFVINSVTNQVGSTGGGIGYQGVPRSVGIEFDTWNNGFPQDNDGNHVGIDINGDIVSVQQARYGTRMNDGQTKYAWIDFNGDTKLLEVRIANTNNRPSAAFLARTVDLVSILQTASVYVGFTSAGGSAYGNHYITSWTFTNQYAPIIVTPPPVTAVCGNGVIEGSEVCDGGPCCSSTCTLLSSSTVCRSSTGTCDSTEFCTGSSPFCPLDTFASSSTVCRSSTGFCDPAETCTGSSASCPADSFSSSSTVCRASNGPCDAAETCTGSSGSCPADSFQSSSTVCRASNGPCDVAETCSGSSAACPTDSFQSSSTVCRAASGVCDVAETCSGSSAACPSNAFLSSSTVCRPSNGDCDVAETCSGASPACPFDAFASSNQVCRDVSGPCDVAETCSGSSSSCPADSFKSSSVVCRSSNGPCDVAETCSGSSGSCPVDSFQSSSTVCRAANGICDVAESCSGSSASCPADGFAAETTVCRSSNGVCDVAESCTGFGTECPVDSFAAASTVCRSSNGPCDIVETCTGTGVVCPADAFQSSSTVCRASNGICDVAESCPGNGAACPTDSFKSSTTVCRASNGPCDAVETCSGSGSDCPTDAFQPTTTVCRASTGICDVDENCPGTGVLCPSDSFKSSSTVCRGSVGPCDPVETCTGNAGSCPADISGAFESECAGLHFNLGGSDYSFLDFNAISFNNFLAETGDVEGRVAVKNNVVLGNGYSVGYEVKPADGHKAFSLIAGGDVTWGSGSVGPSANTEDMFVGGSFSGPQYLSAQSVGGPCNAPGCLSSIFNAAQSCYGGYSTEMASHSDNVAKLLQWSGLYLTCNSNTEKTYYLSLEAAELSQYTYVVADNCNNNARWIINFRGTGDISLSGGSFPANANAVIYNVIGSGRTVNVNSIQLNGNLVAPYNTLSLSSGYIVGRTIVGDVAMQRSTQINRIPCFSQ